MRPCHAQNGYTGGGNFSVTGLAGEHDGVLLAGGLHRRLRRINAHGHTRPPTRRRDRYPLTITATDSGGTPTQSTIVTLTVNPAPVIDFTISASPPNRVVKRGNATTYAVTVTPSGGFSETVTFSTTGCPANTYVHVLAAFRERRRCVHVDGPDDRFDTEGYLFAGDRRHKFLLDQEYVSHPQGAVEAGVRNILRVRGRTYSRSPTVGASAAYRVARQFDPYQTAVSIRELELDDAARGD